MIYRDDFRVESYTRKHDGLWVYQNLVGDQKVWFPCVDLSVPVTVLDENVDMSPIEPSQDERDFR